MKIDDTLAKILKRYGADPGKDVWNCHGTWVAYHRTLEKIANKADIRFEPPVIIQADGAAKIAVICVTGCMGDKTEWSIGEASPANNKNAYPWAMAEKRAKDRVVLKLIGLHGLVYSEDESDDFKETPQQKKIEKNKPPSKADSRPIYDKLYKGIAQIMREGTLSELEAWGEQIKSEIGTINSDWHDQLRNEYFNALTQMRFAEKQADHMVNQARNGSFPEAELDRESV